MKIYKKISLVIILFFINQTYLIADTNYLDFKYILDQSDAGKKANVFLKKQLEEGVKKLKNEEAQLQKEEKEIIQQKKILSPEEYKKKITSLRSKVAGLQKRRNETLEDISLKRNKARKVLLDKLNPIVKNYMVENNIKIVLDKKSVLLGDEELDITQDILVLLNKNLKSINLK
ncbi:MAG: hypothetical protein CBC82_07970 [Cellvibrionales bacterium TMED122]|nr:MAG: hypothetical protein CBC82_07970 [Cellvibrionales bacterium TMED122]|tara:strand:- start:1653 stop:2174 length:522 start_codon:yes stop_codon:yes gene_type:complete